MSAENRTAPSRVARLFQAFDSETQLRRRIVPEAKGVVVEFGFDTSTVEQVYLRGLPRIVGAHHLGVARPL